MGTGQYPQNGGVPKAYGSLAKRTASPNSRDPIAAPRGTQKRKKLRLNIALKTCPFGQVFFVKNAASGRKIGVKKIKAVVRGFFFQSKNKVRVIFSV
jgi:hypothetical protein